MIVTLFRSQLRSEVVGTPEQDEYRETNQRMMDLAEAMPGFVAAGGIKDRKGRYVTVVIFESAEAQRAWREHPEHVEAQRRGREDWYQSYAIDVLTPARSSSFERDSGPSREEG